MPHVQMAYVWLNTSDVNALSVQCAGLLQPGALVCSGRARTREQCHITLAPIGRVTYAPVAV